jgi:hypothetical protein
MDYMKGGELTPPYPQGSPPIGKPVSNAGSGRIPPTYATAGRVTSDNIHGDVTGAKPGLGNQGGSPPLKSAGQMPPSGEHVAPYPVTPRTNKSKDKSVGVE